MNAVVMFAVICLPALGIAVGLAVWDREPVRPVRCRDCGEVHP